MRDFHESGFGATGVIFCALFTFTLFASAGTYSGGSGTAEDPYRISTAEDLIAMGLNTDDYGKSFVLTADIDLAGQSFTMAPIAADTGGIGGESFEGTPFTGTLDGQGHAIRNLTITDELGQDYLGLFGYTTGATIRNLELVNFNDRRRGV